MTDALPTRRRGGWGQLEIYLDGCGWIYASQMVTVAACLARGVDPRVARELRMLREDAPGDVEAAAAFGLDATSPAH